jgi:hypothetical protein
MKNWLKKLVPSTFRSDGHVRVIYTICRFQLINTGWFKTMREHRCVRQDGSLIPWFTYPAIDYITQFDLRERSVFEWGCGDSTKFWADRCKRVVGIESHKGWYEKVKATAPANAELRFSPEDVESYAAAIDADELFDVIVIDGTWQSRLRCAEKAIAHVKPGGMIILDNSDDALQAANTLRAAGFIQVDFTGFAPRNVQQHCTSMFLTRDFNFAPRNDVQPVRSLANVTQPWPGV